MTQMAQRMKKQANLLERLENMKTGDTTWDNIMDDLSEIVVEKEILLMQVEESLREYDTALDYMVRHATDQPN